MRTFVEILSQCAEMRRERKINFPAYNFKTHYNYCLLHTTSIFINKLMPIVTYLFTQ
jgi:hypothetical protein